MAAVRLLFDSLMMRGVVEYNPAARARPPRLVRGSSHTPVFEEAEMVAFLDSIYPNSLKDIRDKAIFSVLLYSWCRVSAWRMSTGRRTPGRVVKVTVFTWRPLLKQSRATPNMPLTVQIPEFK